MASVHVNGATLYYEVRGDGPSLLFISGSTGDAGHWADVADILADEYCVITYDRRGNSRSPRPQDWRSTTLDEQADDAAALLWKVARAPAIVVASSAGASIAANMAVRYPEALRGAVFHEPIFRSGVTNASAIWAGRTALIEEGVSPERTRAATDLFLLSAAGQATYESVDPDLRERLLANGDVLLNVEMRPYLEYEPTPVELGSIKLPLAVTAGVDNRGNAATGHWRYESAAYLADLLGTPLTELPGAHMAYLSEPRAFAEALRPLLGELV